MLVAESVQGMCPSALVTRGGSRGRGVSENCQLGPRVAASWPLV